MFLYHGVEMAKFSDSDCDDDEVVNPSDLKL